MISNTADVSKITECPKCVFVKMIQVDDPKIFVRFQISKKLQEFESKNGGSNGCKDLIGVEKLAKEELDAQVSGLELLLELELGPEPCSACFSQYRNSAQYCTNWPTPSPFRFVK